MTIDMQETPMPSSGTPVSPSPRRPAIVTVALALLWANIAIEGVRLLAEDHFLLGDPAIVGYSVVAMLAILLILFAWFVYKAGQRRNWGRILCVAWSLLPAFGYAIDILAYPVELTAPYYASFVQSALLLGAIVLLFLPASNAWFRPQR